MLSINFNKRIKCPWTQGEVKKVFNIIHRKLKINGELEVNIVGEKEIKELNFSYRGKNKITDVLSFAWGEDGVVKSKFLGQIYICYPQIVRQSKELTIKTKEEFARMLVHGFLHILGYDHVEIKEAQKMFKIQEEIVCLYIGC